MNALYRVVRRFKGITYLTAIRQVAILLVLFFIPSMALGIDGNADIDAVFSNEGQINRVCLGNGAGGFTCSSVSADTNSSYGVALGFVDGDTNLDAVFSNALSGSRNNRVCLGNGAGGFTCSNVSADTNTSRGVALGFIDGDANLDAVFSNYGQINRVCLGNGAGGFTCSNVSADTNNSTGVALSPAPATTIPTMTEWGMIIFMLLAGISAIYFLRRKKITG